MQQQKSIEQSEKLDDNCIEIVYLRKKKNEWGKCLAIIHTIPLQMHYKYSKSTRRQFPLR